MVADRERSMRRVIDLRKALVAENPSRVDLRYKLAAAHNNLGFVLHNSNSTRPELAEPEIRLAVELFGRLVEDYPDVVLYRSGQANGQRHLGQVLGKAGRTADGEAALRRAIDLYAALVRDYPDQPEFRRSLMTTLAWLAVELHGTRPLDALEIRKRQQATAQSLVDDFPNDTSYRADLGYTLIDLAVTLHTLGRDDEAEAALCRAVTIHESLAAEFPREPSYRRALAVALNNLATVIEDRPARLDEAEAHLRRASSYTNP